MDYGNLWESSWQRTIKGLDGLDLDSLITKLLKMWMSKHCSNRSAASRSSVLVERQKFGGRWGGAAPSKYAHVVSEEWPPVLFIGYSAFRVLALWGLVTLTFDLYSFLKLNASLWGTFKLKLYTEWEWRDQYASEVDERSLHASIPRRLHSLIVRKSADDLSRVRSASNVTVITRNLPRKLRVGKIENYP